MNLHRQLLDALGKRSDRFGQQCVLLDHFDKQRRLVTLGAQVSGLRVVRSGVTARDWVVVKGVQRARPGQKVEARREDLKVTDAAGTTGAIPASAAR